MALQQPVAGDLRSVTASFKSITDPERIGDLGAAARSMVERSLTAYETEDAEACRATAADDEVDALCQRASERVTRGLIAETGDDGWSVEQLLDDVSLVLLTVRDLERVADHAVNIAARTLYMIETDPELIC